MAGGWSDFTIQITVEDKAAFDDALKGLLGVTYTPVAVSKQVVNGINYRFVCLAQTVYPGAPVRLAMVDIHFSPEKKHAFVTGIRDLG
ncbi:hypothetical protein GZ77_26300 [Endozoicomonas montiporae]|uniref:Uncharacterized protein n=2 Tax=Endozoicomonas montiporae TaxID=1027273 RepID=A0A081MYJ1_9GAMM|nr:hypothetical protein GZ77_26300 [Endozoicomonas montiporae]